MLGRTPRRSTLDRHGTELLSLRRAGAAVAQLARWLRIERHVVVAATTVGRWLDNARGIHVDGLRDFDAVAALDAGAPDGRPDSVSARRLRLHKPTPIDETGIASCYGQAVAIASAC